MELEIVLHESLEILRQMRCQDCAIIGLLCPTVACGKLLLALYPRPSVE